jgi:hypothetical protein
MVAIVPIGLLLGKADTAFKMVGGSSIVFNIIRTRLFGKILRAVEYPDGDLHTVKIHRMNRYRLQSVIAEAQPPPYPTAFVRPEDVRQISVFTTPHFTEPILTDADVSALADNSWLFWSKNSYEEDPIPIKGVKLDGSHIKKNESKPVATVTDIVLQDRAIAIAGRILRSSKVSTARSGSGGNVLSASARFSQWQYDRVVDLAVDRDAGLLTLARNYGDDEDEFGRHVRRLLQRRDPQSILLADGLDKSADVAADESSGLDGGGVGQQRKVAEPQVELSSRE